MEVRCANFDHWVDMFSAREAFANMRLTNES